MRILKVEEILGLLLGAEQGSFDENVGKRSSASPIDPTLPVFYVVTNALQGRSATEEICVKYNGFTRAQVWWSRDHSGMVGVVCRKMSLKPRKGNDRHGFSGYWMLLARRNKDQMSVNIDDASVFVVQGAPSIVQFWSVKDHSANLTQTIFGSLGFGAQLPPDEKVPLTQADLVKQITLKRRMSGRPEEIPEEHLKRFRQFDSDAILDELFDNPGFLSESDEEQKDYFDAASEISSPQPPGYCSTAGVDVLQEACKVLADDEFQLWYSQYSKYLISEDTSRQIEAAIRNNDPRISKDFMFSNTCAFLEDVPVGVAMYCGTYVSGFTVTDCDEWFRIISKIRHPEGRLGLYEKMLESKLFTLFQHINFKTKLYEGTLDRTDFWFHNVLRFEDGSRGVLRCHSKVVGVYDPYGGFEQVQTRLRIQDVSHLYQEILALPPLPLSM